MCCTETPPTSKVIFSFVTENKDLYLKRDHYAILIKQTKQKKPASSKPFSSTCGSNFLTSYFLELTGSCPTLWTEQLKRSVGQMSQLMFDVGKKLNVTQRTCVCFFILFQGQTGLGIDDGEERWHLPFACRRRVRTNGGAREVSLLMIHLRGEDAAVIRLLIRAVFPSLSLSFSLTLRLFLSPASSLDCRLCQLTSTRGIMTNNVGAKTRPR